MRPSTEKAPTGYPTYIGRVGALAIFFGQCPGVEVVTFGQRGYVLGRVVTNLGNSHHWQTGFDASPFDRIVVEKDEEEFVVPFAKLSAASVALAKKLGSEALKKWTSN
ncbi:MAG: hypothetical protein WCI74_21995, partial [Actinomycetes bacterium]